jgi:hypothetical protein
MTPLFENTWRIGYDNLRNANRVDQANGVFGVRRYALHFIRK